MPFSCFVLHTLSDTNHIHRPQQHHVVVEAQTGWQRKVDGTK